jgi:hypothetical protein
VASENPNAAPFILTPGEISEDHRLIAAPHDFEVDRDAPALAAAMALLLKSANTVLFVDAFYDPFNARYQKTLRECFKLLHTANRRAVCEIHHLDLPKSPPADAIEREARAKFSAVIPTGMTVTIYRWREKNGGADFHARYLLTDRGGIRIDAGFSAEGGGQKTDMSLMDFDLSQAKRLALGRDADVYELVEPILQIAPSGYVEHV